MLHAGTPQSTGCQHPYFISFHPSIPSYIETSNLLPLHIFEDMDLVPVPF